jgi:homocysteine S-methyltransferase
VKSNRLDIIELHNTQQRPLVLDGAIGSQLINKSIPSDKALWSSLANISYRSEVMKLHEEYISAGADIITTNTFRTNPAAVKRFTFNISVEELVKAGVGAATNSIGDERIIIAGSNAPAEDCYQTERTISKSDLEYNHKKHIELLWENGCDIIWNETQSHMDEIEIICEFCTLNKIPYAINLFFTENLNLLSGSSLFDALELIIGYTPAVIGFNCIKPKLFYKFIEKDSLPERWGVYFNCGAGSVNDETLDCGLEPQLYGETVCPLLDLNPFFIGSCCGSYPAHTNAIRGMINEIYRN